MGGGKVPACFATRFEFERYMPEFRSTNNDSLELNPW